MSDINYFNWLISGETEESDLQSCRNVLSSMLKIGGDSVYKQYDSQMEQEANLLFQKFLLHAFSAHEMYKGLTFKSPLSNLSIIDPISMWTVIRAQYECFCAFSHIYLRSNSSNEQKLLYNAWVIAGLINRQKFEVTFPDNIEKIKHERKIINNLLQEIKEIPLFMSLPENKKIWLIDKIQNKNWEFKFSHGNVEKIALWEMGLNAGLKKGLNFDKSYSHMSLYTHPSNVSLFQIRDMFKTGENISQALFALKFSKILNAAMISDYCNYFPVLKLLFNGLPEVNQQLINFYNSVFRGPNYLIQ